MGRRPKLPEIEPSNYATLINANTCDCDMLGIDCPHSRKTHWTKHMPPPSPEPGDAWGICFDCNAPIKEQYLHPHVTDWNTRAVELICQWCRDPHHAQEERERRTAIKHQQYIILTKLPNP